MSSTADDSVPPTVRRAAAWAWRLLVLLAAAVAVLWIIARLEVIVVPVAVALLVTALLLPGVDWLAARGMPRGPAVFLLLISGLAVFGGMLTFVVEAFIDGVPGLVDQVTALVSSSQQWLVDGPLHMSRDQIDNLGNTVITMLRNNQARLTHGALSTAETITEIVTGMFVTLFTLIFFLHGGRGIWRFVVGLFPEQVRQAVHDAGVAGFRSLTGYVRATFLVALVDAIGVGVGLAVLTVPLALPLASLVFLGAFIPLVGAVLTGLLAVLVALIAKGWIYALAALGVILLVNQMESHVLQPMVMGRAVSIHPLAVVLGIAAGAVSAGIVGALLAVPTIAFIDRAARVLLAHPLNAAVATSDGAGEGPAGPRDQPGPTGSPPDPLPASG